MSVLLFPAAYQELRAAGPAYVPDDLCDQFTGNAVSRLLQPLEIVCEQLVINSEQV